jgi:hypothetical protein
MASLKIHDLNASTHLDAKALAVIYGGISFGWIRPYLKSQPSSSFGTTIIGQVSNTFLINPTFNRIYNTVNQLEFVTIDATENVDSLISVDVNLGQTGASRSLPLPI